MEFPRARWGNEEATFLPGAPPDKTIPVAFVIVLLWQKSELVLARITGRGWCVPSGHVEEGETPEAAATRECHEEVGAQVENLALLGHYALRNLESGQTRHAFVFTADVLALDEIPEGSEANERAFFSLDAIPDVYFTWDALLEAVFVYAASATRRAFSSSESSPTVLNCSL